MFPQRDLQAGGIAVLDHTHLQTASKVWILASLKVARGNAGIIAERNRGDLLPWTVKIKQQELRNIRGAHQKGERQR